MADAKARILMVPGSPPRQAISRAAIVAATFAALDAFFLVTELDLSWDPYGERLLALAGLVTLAFGIAAACCLGNTRLRVTGGIMALAAVLVGGFCFFAVPATCRIRPTAMRANCQSNLRQIGLAINGYA